MAKRKSFDYQGPGQSDEDGESGAGARKRLQHVSRSKLRYHSSSQSSPPKWFGFIFILVGAYPFLVSLGLLPTRPGSVHCPMIVLTGIGVAFMGAGLLCVLQAFQLDRFPRLTATVGTLTMVGFLAPFIWLGLFAPDIPLVARIVVGGITSFVAIASLVAGSITVIKGGKLPMRYETLHIANDDAPMD